MILSNPVSFYCRPFAQSAAHPSCLLQHAPYAKRISTFAAHALIAPSAALVQKVADDILDDRIRNAER